MQGVGFRPFVFNLAERLGIAGWVLNHSSGVDIEAEADADTLDAFVKALRNEAPPLARIEDLQTAEIEPLDETTFEIRASQRREASYQLISPDIATCDDCLREVLDPNDRRYRYPFINCTNCGPRFTIISDIPYDRVNTTMRVFPLCPDCQREYEDPRDRRFHAQPNACPVCGPSLELVRLSPGLGTSSRAAGGASYPVCDAERGDLVRQSADLLGQGNILAIKGLGGFHLACDATDAAAVDTLRRRKHRPHKPFAVMMPTLHMVRAHCLVGIEEEQLLTSPASPIVLLPWREGSAIVDSVAPNNRYLGVMLPYTPLHHLLLRDVGRPLVMTSGNLTEEPIAAENDEARRRLGHLADAMLLHNRDIYARYDDSVWAVVDLPCVAKVGIEATDAEQELGAPRRLPQSLRRARGYAPFPIKLPFKMGQILACGPELKNTFCLTRDEYAFVSQHIGDMENLETLEHYERSVALYEQLFRIKPEKIAYDEHPDYMATRYAKAQAELLGLPTVGIRHHHAHIAACLADNGWGADDGQVIGVALDGTGLGDDGHIWGGEWLLADYHGYERLAHLQYLPLPGGDAATRNPWRIAYAYGDALMGVAPDIDWPDEATPAARGMLQQQLDRRLRCPMTSSMGRLFDAVSALLGICDKTSYDAQAAIELEMLAVSVPWERRGPRVLGAARPAALDYGGGLPIIDVKPLWQSVLQDMAADVPTATIAWRFHQALADMTAQVCVQLSKQTGVSTIALSGGCYQNRLLLSLTVPALESCGLTVLLHQQVPSNDGGLSLGQAVIAHFANS